MAKSKAKTPASAVSSQSVGAMYAGVITLNAYWILIFFKHSFKSFSNALNWYDPVGPLMSLFIIGLLVFVASCLWISNSLQDASEKELRKHTKTALELLVVSAILVFFMTFPPFFEPIADAIFG